MIWHSAEKQEILSLFESDEACGLTTEQALKIYKQNSHEIRKTKPSYLKLLGSRLKNYLNIIALIAIIISIIISVISDNNVWIFSVTAAAIILLDNALTAYQEYAAQKIKFNMKYSVTSSVKVIRDGAEQIISSDELVCGDIILLQAGDLIPADARLLESVNLRCDEFVLTHETVDAEKDASSIAEDIAPPSSRKNMLFEGCCITHGTAKAIVTDIGKNTELKKLKKITGASKNTSHSFGNILEFISKYSVIITLVAAFAIFGYTVFSNMLSSSGFANVVTEAFTNSFIAAIAVIPSALPACVALILSLALKKQERMGNSIAKTSTLEKIAGISIICADKTGVLTPDKMKVSKIFSGKEVCDLSVNSPSPADIAVVKSAMLCGNSINFEDNSFEAARDSGDKALEEFCVTYENLNFADSLNIYPMEASVPFENGRKIITSINMIGGKHYVISKGAPEELLKLCDNVNTEAALKISEEMANDGLRVIAVALKQIEDVPAIPNATELEQNMSFSGFIGLEDIPEPEALHAIEECARLGIRTVIITGDSITTAKAVARRLGLFPDGMQAISGAEIQALTDEELLAKINDYSVFARVSPDDKYRIVKALERSGEKVAVTGFKNSDAPVLRKADVGFTCSNSPSDVVTNAADVILEDIKISNILKVIKSSLGVFYNVKKVFHYFLSCSLGGLLTIFIGALLFSENLFIAPQLLLISLIISMLPAFTMGFSEGKNRSYKNRLQEHKKLFSLDSLISITLQAVSLCAITLIGYSHGQNISEKQTVAILILALSQILHLLPNSSDKLLINSKISNYVYILGGVAAAIVLLFICLLTPVADCFGFVPLDFEQYSYAIILSLMFVAADILIKIFFAIYRKAVKR
ncbi:MAG: cation-transporting P-type ATPase [Clostridiales bacterium]|nr:cation-transporting P-type ATPase [Candidatus Equinaster intestinalis]